MTSHVHAEAMKQFAQDAANHAEPWRLWEDKHKYSPEWNNLTQPPNWFADVDYRRIADGTKPVHTLYEINKKGVGKTFDTMKTGDSIRFAMDGLDITFIKTPTGPRATFATLTTRFILV
jgi:hypothetical protein